MKAEHAKKIADQALTTLTEALAQGKSEALTRYLAMMGKFHHYSFRNVCLIAMQKPEATRVAGFSAWKQLGRYVKQGEKGIVIVAPMMIQPKDEERSRDPDGQPSQPVMRFRGAFVFDVSQTEGQPLPELSRTSGDPGKALARLKDAIRGRGITLDHDDVPEGCDGVSRGGRISIRAGLPAAEEFSVTVHELAHELLHRAEERRGKDKASKTLRETQAEAVAYVVSSAVGLDVGGAARDYIHLYDGEAKTLIASLEAVQSTAAKIIEAITPKEHQEGGEEQEEAAKAA